MKSDMKNLKSYIFMHWTITKLLICSWYVKLIRPKSNTIRILKYFVKEIKPVCCCRIHSADIAYFKISISRYGECLIYYMVTILLCGSNIQDVNIKERVSNLSLHLTLCSPVFIQLCHVALPAQLNLQRVVIRLTIWELWYNYY